jgi:hypothetical protein
MRVLVCGVACYEEVADFLSKVEVDEVIHGGSVAGTMAEVYAATLLVPVRVYKADWSTYGRKASTVRNREMLDYLTRLTERSEVSVVCFGPIGYEAKSLVKMSRALGIPVSAVSAKSYRDEE